MIRKGQNLDKIEDFMRDKETHIFHPIYSHDVYGHGNPDSIEKLSIQGKDVEDAIELLHLTKDYLLNKNIGFKVGTKARFDMRFLKLEDQKEMERLTEQSFKAMTIYCPVGTNILDLASDINELIKGYKGYLEVPHPESYYHYKEGIYYRRDINENGEYINPN